VELVVRHGGVGRHVAGLVQGERVLLGQQGRVDGAEQVRVVRHGPPGRGPAPARPRRRQQGELVLVLVQLEVEVEVPGAPGTGGGGPGGVVGLHPDRDRGGVDGAELVGLVREEADAARASHLVLAEAGAVLRRVEPALEDAMRVLAGIALAAGPGLAEVGAGHAGVGVAARVVAARILARVHEGALDPVVGVGAGAGLHLEAVHAELVRAEEAAIEVREGQVGRVLLPLLRLLCWCSCDSFSQPEHSFFSMLYFVVLVLLRLLALCIMLI
jgi:hypothetical protein